MRCCSMAVYCVSCFVGIYWHISVFAIKKGIVSIKNMQRWPLGPSYHYVSLLRTGRVMLTAHVGLPPGRVQGVVETPHCKLSIVVHDQKVVVALE